MMLTDPEIREMAALGSQAGVEVSLFLGPRGAWDTGGQSFATAAAGGIARGDAGDRAVHRRGRARRRVRNPLVPRRRPRRPRDARADAAAGELPREPRPEDVGAHPVREPRTARALEELGATTINVSTDLSPPSSASSAGVLRAARRLRRGARRPGWLRPLLRRAGDRPARSAGVRQARAAQRAEHLPVRAASRGAGREARTGSAYAEPSSSDSSSRNTRRNWSKGAAKTGRRTSASRSRERALRGHLHGRAGRHPRRARTPRADAPAVDPAPRARHAPRRAGVHGEGRPRGEPGRGGVRRGDPQGALDARRRPGGPCRRVRLRAGRLRAPRRSSR